MLIAARPEEPEAGSAFERWLRLGRRVVPEKHDPWYLDR